MNGSENVAKIRFVPWVRVGLSGAIQTPGGSDGDGLARVPLTFSVRAEGGGNPTTAQRATDVPLIGPGEIAAIDPSEVVRVWPEADVVDVEPNYFPLVELAQPDFPWRYTPTAPEEDRLLPWLVLVVLLDAEIQSFAPPDEDRALPTLTVRSARSLPDLRQSWAWAHASANDLEPDEDLATALSDEPELFVSRLLCPRRLLAETPYQAFVVPSFDRGRLAGLDDEDGLAEQTDALAPAWDADSTASVILPVYYRWSFQTGRNADFESLARKLRPFKTPPTVGYRDLDAGDPGAGLPPASANPMRIDGALRSPSRVMIPWEGAERGPFVQALRQLVNRPADLLAGTADTPLVGPPLYGRWYAERARLEEGAPPPWFETLNADPRLRAVAALGVGRVQDRQGDLTTQAWDQTRERYTLRDVQEDLAWHENQLRFAQLAAHLAGIVQTELPDMPVVPLTELLQLTQPLHTKVLASPRTVGAVLKASPIPNGVLGGAFRRIARAGGPVDRRLSRPDAGRGLIERLNDGELSPAPPLTEPPAGTVTFRDAGAGLVPGWATPDALTLLRRIAAVLYLATFALGALALSTLAMGGPVAVAIGAPLAGALAVGAATYVERARRRAERALALAAGELTAADVESAPAPLGFRPVEAEEGSHLPDRAAAGQGAAAGEVEAFYSSLARMHAALSARPPRAAERPRADLVRVREALTVKLDPARTFRDAVRARLHVPWPARQVSDDPVAPVMAHPRYYLPTYKWLGGEWVLPGVEQIDANSVTLLESNDAFVEAFLVGVNQELARELLFQGFPTDRRGTYCRQFWGSRIVPFPPHLDPLTREADEWRAQFRDDIEPIHTWRKDADLGENGLRQTDPNRAVILVRGELLSHYPGTRFLAAPALAPGVYSTDEDEWKEPVFSGELDPDLAFFGFDLTVAAARGDDGGFGWFFVIQEPPTGTRFGLDLPPARDDGTFDAAVFGRTVKRWDALTWGDLAKDEEAYRKLHYVDLSGEGAAALPRLEILLRPGEPDVAWHAADGSTAAHVAYATLQKRFRIVAHASALLLPEEG